MGKRLQALSTLRLVLFLFWFPAVGQKPAWPDSLRRVLASPGADTMRVRRLLQLSRACLDEDSVWAPRFAQRAYELARHRQFTNLMPKTLLGVGEALQAQRRLPEALKYYHRARRASERLGLLNEWAQAYRAIGKARTQMERPRAAQRAFQAGLALQLRSDDTMGTAIAYNNVGYAHFLQTHYGEALQAYLAGLKLLERNHEREAALMSVHLLRNIGGVYGRQEDYQPAQAYLAKARRILRKFPDPETEAGVLGDLSACYLSQRRDSSALPLLMRTQQLIKQVGEHRLPRESALVYYMLGDLAKSNKNYPASIAYLRRSAARYRKISNNGQYLSVLLELAQVYLAQQRYDSAFASAHRALTLAERAGYGDHAMHIQKFLADANATVGDSGAAFRYQTRFQALHDSLFNKEKAEQLAAFNTRYETQKKEAQITLLQHNTRFQQRVRNVLTGGLVAVALAGGVAWWRYRRERRARRRVQAQELELVARNHELTQAQQQLRQSLGEKETLLQEVHHRVKNNLQIISSLLALQANKQTLPKVKEVLIEGQNWVQSIALVHEMLYQSENLSCIDMQIFLERLTQSLGAAFAPLRKAPVGCQVQAARILFNTSTAVPVALIVNELVSNAYEHAFPAEQAGNIGVSLTRTRGAEYLLTLDDDGVGLPPSFLLERTTSLGLRLVKSLTLQLHGTLQVHRKASGTSFVVAFVEMPEGPLPTAAPRQILKN